MIVKSGPVTGPSTVIVIGMPSPTQPKPTWTVVDDGGDGCRSLVDDDVGGAGGDVDIWANCCLEIGSVAEHTSWHAGRRFYVDVIWSEGCCLTDRDSELEARRSGGVDLKPFECGADGWGRGCGGTERDGRVHVSGEAVYACEIDCCLLRPGNARREGQGNWVY